MGLATFHANYSNISYDSQREVLFLLCHKWEVEEKMSMQLIYRFIPFIFIVDTNTDVHMFPHFAHLHRLPMPPYLWPSSHYYLYPWVMHVCSSANPFTFFHPVTPLPLTAVSLFRVSMCSYLCFYFVYQFILFIRSRARQGCPLSPLLLNIWVDSSTIMEINQAGSTGSPSHSNQ